MKRSKCLFRFGASSTYLRFIPALKRVIIIFCWKGAAPALFSYRPFCLWIIPHLSLLPRLFGVWFASASHLSGARISHASSIGRLASPWGYKQIFVFYLPLALGFLSDSTLPAEKNPGSFLQTDFFSLIHVNGSQEEIGVATAVAWCARAHPFVWQVIPLT